MKIFILYLISGLMCATSLKAQNKYEDSMNKALELWQEGRPLEAANIFERIGNAEENWLPFYYAAQVKVVQAFSMTNSMEKKELIDAAQQLLDKAKALAVDEAEMLVLQAMLHTATLTIDPATYGMTLSPVIYRLYAQALEKAPNNPRAILSKAEWDMGSARYFGEDPAVYCRDIKRSLKVFAAEDHSPTTAPAWGEERAKTILEKSCATE